MTLFLLIFSSLLLCSTLLSLIKNDYWIFRVFDYPRLQKFVLSLFCLTLVIIFLESTPTMYWTVIITLTANAAYLFSLILPFTIFSKKQVLNISKVLQGQGISIMIANVYEDNTNSAGCLKEIYKTDPDVVLLLETNERWDKETSVLADRYAYQVKVPLENTYGMLLYSKFALSDTAVKYLVEDDIPSIHTRIELPCGQELQLFAVHPTPPVPSENPRATERDKELLLVADLAKASTLPVIVIGDLNDVAWSYTTELFLKMSGLLDPRRGRGFFNSFHAHYPVMRFPLDHAFISTNFKLKHIDRLANFDSDHFPIFINLQYEENANLQQESMEADADEIQEAEEKKTKE
ncbi:endonuclease/exonuclease/phosphatase family protein [Pedobacter sp. AW31-3R]|uniref:endonuclease/exonuclease/phosphatase family protein n=1 Tax=Pedobacter sp. AW31-3R TaxID=3445781 RepID=UPI003FA0A660